MCENHKCRAVGIQKNRGSNLKQLWHRLMRNMMMALRKWAKGPAQTRQLMVSKKVDHHNPSCPEGGIAHLIACRFLYMTDLAPL